MIRYRVESKANSEGSNAWGDYLAHHLAEVVLAGAFTGATLSRDGDTFRCDYDAPSREALDRYFEEAAPALRADAEEKFPAGVDRSRSESDVNLRVSAPFPWLALGLVDASGAPAPCPSDGPFTLAYWAPWCVDCLKAWPALVATVAADPQRSALVRVYAPTDEGLITDLPEGLTRWSEPSDKVETSRCRSFHATLRQLSGARAKWGVPVVHRLWFAKGRFVAIFEG